MTIAVIMAGGRSSRMRASSGARHKALVEVNGITLLERNVIQLLSNGFSNIVVVVSHLEQELIEYVESKLVNLKRDGVEIHCLLETKPLGTIGILRTVLESSQTAVVVNVDNLCSLELNCFCLLYTSPSPRDKRQSRMPSSA